MKLIVDSLNQSVDWATLCDITTLIISLLVQEVITKFHTYRSDPRCHIMHSLL